MSITKEKVVERPTTTPGREVGKLSAQPRARPSQLNTELRRHVPAILTVTS
jgi:hypothetical protein